MNNYLGNWEVQIINTMRSFNNRIYLMQRFNNQTVFITHQGTQVAVRDDVDIKEEDVWFAEMNNDQLQAFANSLASKGIKTTNDSKNEGLLEATKYHLEDMRTLLKLNMKKETYNEK